MTWYKFDPIDLFLKSAAFCVALFACALPALAQEVVVHSRNGAMTLRGEVLGFDGLHLRLQTEHGPLTLNYASVRCEGAACPTPGVDAPVIRFAGAARMGHVILPALVEGFARARGLTAERFEYDAQTSAYVLHDQEGADAIAIVFRAIGMDAGLDEMWAGQADVLMANRALTAAEVSQGWTAGLGVLDSAAQLRLLALQAQVVVAAPSQRVREVSLQDVARAMAGEITNWAELGGEDVPIRLHLPAVATGVSQGFIAGIVARDRRRLSRDVVFHDSTLAMAEAMIHDRGALGVLPVADLGNLHHLTLRDRCGGATVLSASGLKTEDYPLSSPMFLIRARRYAPPLAEAFLAWTGGSEAGAILRRAGVETQDPAPVLVGYQRDRLASALLAAQGDEAMQDALAEVSQRLAGHVRLSLTFRFEEGARRLDGVSRLHAHHLAEAIRDGRFEGLSLILMGFSDADGGVAVNRTLSLGRANAVRDAVEDILGGALPDGVQITTAALGEGLPIACDDTPWGRRANRRVELWVGPLE